MAQLPLHEVIYQDLLAQIRGGELAPGDRLPSESALSEQYGVSRMTARRAIERLHAEQLVTRRSGSGTYVAQPRSAYRSMNRLGPFSDEVGASAAEVRTEVKSVHAVQAPEEVRAALGLKPRQRAVRLLRVRLVDGAPAAVQDSWLPYRVAPGLVRDELIGGSLYRTLLERWGVRLRHAEQQITATTATPEQAALLDVEPGSPLLFITRTAFGEDGRPVEWARSWTKPDFPLRTRLEA